MKMVNEVGPALSNGSERLVRVVRIAVGLAAIAVSVTYAGWLMLKTLGESPPLRWSLALCALLLYVGANLLSSRKYAVLYLRRFRMPANAVVRGAVKGGLGRTFRLVTLDDSRFRQVGVPLLERLAGILGIPLLGALMLTGGFLLILRLLDSGDAAIGIAQDLIHLLHYWSGVLWAGALLAYTHLWRVRRRSRLRVRTPRQAARLVYRAHACGTWWLRSAFLAPQITIAHVSDAVWREAVSAVAAESAAALIDISEPTEHLEWEIEHLRVTGRACVFIAERERLQSWMAAPDERGVRVREWVGEDAVLVYGAGSRAEGRRFRRQLGNALARAAASTKRKRSAPLGFRLWVQEFGRSYAYYGFWLLVAVLTGEALGGVL